MIYVPLIIVSLLTLFCCCYAWFIITDATRQADNIHLQHRIRKFLS